MNFETPPVSMVNTEREKEKDKTSRLSGAVAGAVLSVGMMAGQAAEAQTAPTVERHEQMERVASGVLSQSNEVFVIDVKKGSAVMKEGQKGEPTLSNYSCENITVKIGDQVFQCTSAALKSFRGPQLPRAVVVVKNGERTVEFFFTQPTDFGKAVEAEGKKWGKLKENFQGAFAAGGSVNQKDVKNAVLSELDLFSDEQQKPVFNYYTDTRSFEKGLMFHGSTEISGVHPINGVKLEGILSKL